MQISLHFRVLMEQQLQNLKYWHIGFHLCRLSSKQQQPHENIRQEHCFLILEFRQFVFSQRAVSNLFLEPLCGLTIRSNIIYGGTVTYGLFIIVQLKSSVEHGCYLHTRAPRAGILQYNLVLCNQNKSMLDTLMKGCSIFFFTFNNKMILFVHFMCKLNLEFLTSNQDGQYKNKRVILDPGNFTILNTEDSRNMEAKR